MSADPSKIIPDGAQQANSTAADPAPAEDIKPTTDSADEKLQESLRQLREENQRLNDQLLRRHAELDNFRKRSQREKDEHSQYALFEAMKALLPVLDGFELAVGSNGDGEDYRKGVELIYQQFSGVLHKLGLTTIESVGREFDPREHEAIGSIETDRVPEHHVAEEMQRGYFFKGRLLRPARVQVAKKRGG